MWFQRGNWGTPLWKMGTDRGHHTLQMTMTCYFLGHVFRSPNYIQVMLCIWLRIVNPSLVIFVINKSQDYSFRTWWSSGSSERGKGCSSSLSMWMAELEWEESLLGSSHLSLMPLFPIALVCFWKSCLLVESWLKGGDTFFVEWVINGNTGGCGQHWDQLHISTPAAWKPGEVMKVRMWREKWHCFEERDTGNSFFLLICSLPLSILLMDSLMECRKRQYRAEKWALAWSPETWVLIPNLLCDFRQLQHHLWPLFPHLGKMRRWTTEIIHDWMFFYSIWNTHLCSMAFYALSLWYPPEFDAQGLESTTSGALPSLGGM